MDWGRLVRAVLKSVGFMSILLVVSVAITVLVAIADTFLGEWGILAVVVVLGLVVGTIFEYKLGDKKK